jgi:hypothetical protein
MSTRVQHTRKGARLWQHGCVLSETLAAPGPTHSVFDVLAVAVSEFAPEGPVAMLGFAAGGMMAPLRAAGPTGEVRAVDLSGDGYKLYRSVTRRHPGQLSFSRMDAVDWLRGEKARFAAIVEDLSVPVDEDVVKPEVSWSVLPPLMSRRLRAGGVMVSNLLPTPGMPWGRLVASARVAASPAVLVGLHDFHNRVLIQGGRIDGARSAGGQLRSALQRIGSRLAGRITLRALP